MKWLIGGAEPRSPGLGVQPLPGSRAGSCFISSWFEREEAEGDLITAYGELKGGCGEVGAGLCPQVSSDGTAGSGLKLPLAGFGLDIREWSGFGMGCPGWGHRAWRCPEAIGMWCLGLGCGL